MNKFQAILDRCKCGVFLTVNEHRDYYESASDFLVNRDEKLPSEQPELFARMVELDTVICLQFYPDTPIGSYVIWHHDLDAALDEGLRALGIAAPVQAPAVVDELPIAWGFLFNDRREIGYPTHDTEDAAIDNWSDELRAELGKVVPLYLGSHVPVHAYAIR